MAITSWAVIKGELGREFSIKAVPRANVPLLQFGSTVPGNAQGIVPPYGQIFPRGKT